MSSSAALHPTIETRPATEHLPQRRRRRSWREPLTGVTMAAPAVVLLVVFFVVPVVLSLGLAFTNARLVSPRPARFIGLDNFTTLLGDSLFWASLRNTLYFAVVVV